MLTSIRNQARSWVMKTLFAFLIVAFAVWGIGDVFRTPQAEAPILKIGSDYTYTRTEFDREMRLAIQNLSQREGIQVTPAMFAQFGGAQGLVDQAENAGLLQVYGDRLGFNIPQQAAIMGIESDPKFAGATGRFERNRFEFYLRQLGQGEEQFVALAQAQLRNGYMLTAVSGPVAVPQVLLNNIHAYLEEQRIAETVLVPNSSVTDVAEPDDATLKTWYEGQSSRYQAPEYRAGLLVQMMPSDFIQDVAVSAEEIDAEYQARLAEYSTLETRNVEQVVVQDQAVADKIIAAVKGGTAFAQAVKDATQGDPVSLGQVTKDKLPADIADAVFALPAGGVSDALKSPFGLHVAFVAAITPATTRPLAEVEGELRNGLALGRAAEARDSVRVQMEDELAGGAPLGEVAEKLGLKQEKFAAIDAGGLDRNGANLGISPEAVGLIFETESGEPGYVSALTDGSYAVAQVDEVTPPTVRPLDEVRDQAVADWKSAQQSERAKKIAEEIADKVKGGATLGAEATARGLTLKTTQAFHRSEGDAENGVNGILAGALFKLKAGEVTLGDSLEGTIVARLTAINPATAATPEETASLADRTARGLANDLRQSFVQALKAELPVTRDDEIWQSAIAGTATE